MGGFFEALVSKMSEKSGPVHQESTSTVEAKENKMEVQETEKELKMLWASINKLETAIQEINRKLDDISGKVNVLNGDDELIAADLPKANSGLASLRAVYTGKQVGERFEFGRYPQSVNGEVKPITWRVLRRDLDSLLVISEYALDAKPYNEELCNITWSDCTLRSWLNGEFLEKAFTAQEQSVIKLSRIPNNTGGYTNDRVFLLSIDEAERFFANFDDRTTKSTAYAIVCGTYTCRRDATTWWWLRSHGHGDNDAADVDVDGGVDGFGNHVDNAVGAVRPAFRIAI